MSSTVDVNGRPLSFKHTKSSDLTEIRIKITWGLTAALTKRETLWAFTF
ncbi:MAG: hypothetical protein ACK521_04100 [bacterium]